MRQRASKSPGAQRVKSTRKSGSPSSTTRSRRTTSSTRSAAHRNSHGKRKWSAGVHTESTYPQEGLFKKDAETIARSLASKKVSPKGPASGMRMLTFYVNRAGKNLSAGRRRVLEHAKELLHTRIEKSKGARSRKSPARRRNHR